MLIMLLSDDDKWHEHSQPNVKKRNRMECQTP